MSITVPRQRANGSAPTLAPNLPAHQLRWWRELLLVIAVYAAYSSGRLLARGNASTALDHGRRILHIQQFLHLDPERALNRLLTDHTWLGVTCDFAYATLHYVVTPLVLIWLWRWHADRYRAARTWLALCTVLGLIGFILLPTAPPRLLESSYGFVDTMARYASFGWWGSDASAPRGLGGLTNQYAAMPSLHVGWALWCGVLLWRHSRSIVVRTIGVLYPIVITFVVLGTANHYLLDAVAGAAVITFGAVLSRYALRLTECVRIAWLIKRGHGGATVPADRSAAQQAPAQAKGGAVALTPAPRADPPAPVRTALEPGSRPIARAVTLVKGGKAGSADTAEAEVAADTAENGNPSLTADAVQSIGPLGQIEMSRPIARRTLLTISFDIKHEPVPGGTPPHERKHDTVG